MQNTSLGGKKYIFVCVDDFAKFTWVGFLKEKSEAFDIFKTLIIKIQVEKNDRVVRLRSDHGKEFENTLFDDFCAANGISHEFSAPITPQHNGVVERKNRVIQEMARVMLFSKDVPKNLWAEAVSTACYIINRAYRVYNFRTKNITESINVVIDDIGSQDIPKDSIENDILEQEVESLENITKSICDHNIDVSSSNDSIDLSCDNSDLNIDEILQLVSQLTYTCYISKIEPKNIKEALTDDFWISAMQDELNQFVRNDVWELVPRPDHTNVVGIKWIFRNKSDEQGIVVRNKARLVTQGYS
ncbi:hypothetical protein UlMin_008881 [Ulmus minor]